MSKSKLRQERERIISLLFGFDIQNMVPKDADDMIFDGEESSAFVVMNVLQYFKHASKIDEIIKENLFDWKLERVTFMDRAIIRYATYELMFSDTPAEIVINEAIELTKKYSDSGDGKARKFNNKVIDNIRKAIQKEG